MKLVIDVFSWTGWSSLSKWLDLASLWNVVYPVRCIQKGLNQEGQFTLQVGSTMLCAGVLTWIKRVRKAYPEFVSLLLHCQHSRASCLASQLSVLPSHYGLHPQSQKRTKSFSCRLLLVKLLITSIEKLMDTNAFGEEISLCP